MSPRAPQGLGGLPLVWAVALLAACGDDGSGVEPGLVDDTGELDTGEPVVEGFTFCDGTPVLTTCPDDALTPEEADGRSVLSQELSWRWSPECQSSVADVVYVQLPEDTAGFTLTVDVGLDGSYAELARDGEDRQGPVGERYATPGHWPPAHSITMPWAPEEAELGGCWAVLPRADNYEPDTLSGTLDLFVRRGEVEEGRLAIVGVVVDDAAMTEAQVEEVMGVAAEAYSAGGIQVDVAPTELLDFMPGEALGVETDRRALLQSWTDPNGTGAIPVFFVAEYDTSGTIGIAGGIPGSPLAGTASSGVTVAVNPLKDFGTGEPDVAYMGTVVTHELGHQLGLWHVTERDGQTFDALLDTPECDASHDDNGDLVVSVSECAGAGADNIMFWQSDGGGQDQLTDDQLFILARGGAVRPL